MESSSSTSRDQCPKKRLGSTPSSFFSAQSASHSMHSLGSKLKSRFRNLVHTAAHTTDAPTSPPAKSVGNKCRSTLRKIARMLRCHKSDTSQQPTPTAPSEPLPQIHLEATLARFDAKWGPILNISDESIIELARNLGSSIPKEALADGVEIKVLAIMKGYNNRVFVVQYGEGLKVCVRVPACAWEGSWTEKDAQSLRAQALTMRHITKHTGCSLGNVLTYDTTFNNAIHAPHMVMSYLEGRTVEDLWFDEEGPLPLEEKRQNILRSLAHQVAQLRSLTFNKIGALQFSSDEDDDPEIGPLHNLSFGVSRTPSFLRYVDEQSNNVQPSSDALLRGRLDNWKKEVTSPSEQNPNPEGNQLQHWENLGTYRLLSMVLDELPLQKDGDGEHFVITPPDFDWQNMLADDHGNVTAILDWDRVDTAPGFVGCCAFPEFLVGDWQPNDWYAWPHWAPNVMSPMQYDKYRADYTRYMIEACNGEGDCKYTAKSHIYKEISQAMGMTKEQKKMLEQIMALAVPRVNLETMLQCIGDKGLTAEQEECIRQGLKEVLAY